MTLDELRTLAGEVAPLLGEGWAQDTDDQSSWCTRLNGPDGAGLLLSIEVRGGRVRVTGHYPIYQGYISGDRPELTVAAERAERGAAAVAQAIRSRLLPRYLPLLAQAAAYVRKAAAVDEARKAALRRVVAELQREGDAQNLHEGPDDALSASIAAGYYPQGYRETGPRTVYVDARCGGAVKLHAMEVSPAEAVAIVRVLRGEA